MNMLLLSKAKPILNQLLLLGRTRTVIGSSGTAMRQMSYIGGLQYRPKMQVNFGKENRFHLYHSEGGERFLTNCTRLNMLFIAGNSMLLLLEIVSPCKADIMHSTSSS